MELQAVIKRNVDEVYVSLNIVIAGKGLSRSLDAHWPTNRLCHAVTATKKIHFVMPIFALYFVSNVRIRKKRAKNAQKFYQITTRGRKIKIKQNQKQKSKTAHSCAPNENMFFFL